MAVGEKAHKTGEQGTRRAKRWLEATMRVRQAWTNEDEVQANRLEFHWPHSTHTFSFDFGGILTGGDVDGHFFLAESKKYAEPSDQGTHFDNWVAKCYVVCRDEPKWAEHYMWITWAPFRSTSWSTLCSKESVVKGLLTNRKRVFDEEDAAKAEALIDLELASKVADMMWIIVLSDKQEDLVISPVHRSWIIQRQAEEDWR